MSRVRFLPQCGKFGYGDLCLNWIAVNAENLNAISDLLSGKVVNLPQEIAEDIDNVIDVDTGNIISINHTIGLSREELQSFIEPEKSISLRTLKPVKDNK